jgi:two-component system, cell cycle sensor histidine kinase and response regulator CckA
MKRNLLVVDDDTEILEFVREVLDSTEFHCLTASGYQEAVAIANDPANPIDILLTDIIIPPFHGRDLANKIVRMHPKIKVLFMSGYPLKLLKSNGLLPPHTDYLPKPFARFQLMKSLQSVCEVGQPWSMVTEHANFDD